MPTPFDIDAFNPDDLKSVEHIRFYHNYGSPGALCLFGESNNILKVNGEVLFSVKDGEAAQRAVEEIGVRIGKTFVPSDRGHRTNWDVKQ
jgi:hypothetical protein